MMALRDLFYNAAMEIPTPTLSAEKAAATPRHMPYLDGIRGLAALFVVLHHATMEYATAVPRSLTWLENGEAAVIVFIVLSGYCLMLPVLREGGVIRGGFLEFARRRAWRILPTYYAVFLASWGLTLAIPALRHPAPDMRWGFTLPLTAGGFVSHIFLIQHFRQVWQWQGDYPMWSISVEWWLYAIFALVLVPVAKRFGSAAVLIGSVLVGFGSSEIIGRDWRYLHFHFLGLFGLGVAAAVFGAAQDEKPGASSRPALFVAAAFGAAYLIELGKVSPPDWAGSLTMAATLGVAITGLIAYGATEARRHQKPTPIMWLLDHPASVWLGTISYSVYLVHAPILALTHAAISGLGMNGHRSLGVEIAIGVPISIAVGWLINRVIEVPSHKRARTKR